MKKFNHIERNFIVENQIVVANRRISKNVTTISFLLKKFFSSYSLLSFLVDKSKILFVSIAVIMMPKSILAAAITPNVANINLSRLEVMPSEHTPAISNHNSSIYNQLGNLSDSDLKHYPVNSPSVTQVKRDISDYFHSSSEFVATSKMETAMLGTVILASGFDSLAMIHSSAGNDYTMAIGTVSRKLAKSHFAIEESINLPEENIKSVPSFDKVISDRIEMGNTNSLRNRTIATVRTKTKNSDASRFVGKETNISGSSPLSLDDNNERNAQESLQ